MTGAIGLDKVSLLLPVEVCKIAPEFDAPLRPAVRSTAAPDVGEDRVLYRDTAGAAIRGARVESHRGSDYQFSIVPDRAGGTSVVLVHFSAGVGAESNLVPLSRDACMDALQAVERDLRRRGAVVPLEKRGKLYRVDVARNVALSEPVPHYMPLFTAAGARKTTRRADFGGTGFYLGNKQWELAFYDKGQQMRENGYPGIDCPENTLRPELRLLNGAMIKSRLGLPEASIRELRAGWGALAAVHRDAVETELFRHRAELEKPSPYDLAVMAGAASGAKAKDNFLRDVGRVQLIREMGLAGAIDLMCRQFAPGDSDSDKRQRDRIERELKAANFWLMVHAPRRRGVGLVALYRELEEKLLAVA